MEIIKSWDSESNRLSVTPDPKVSITSSKRSGEHRVTTIGGKFADTTDKVGVTQIARMSNFELSGVLFAMCAMYEQTAIRNGDEYERLEKNHSQLMAGIAVRATQYYLTAREVDEVVEYIDYRQEHKFGNNGEGGITTSVPTRPITPTSSASISLELVNVA